MRGLRVRLRLGFFGFQGSNEGRQLLVEGGIGILGLPELRARRVKLAGELMPMVDGSLHVMRLLIGPRGLRLRVMFVQVILFGEVSVWFGCTERHRLDPCTTFGRGPMLRTRHVLQQRINSSSIVVANCDCSWPTVRLLVGIATFIVAGHPE